MHLRCRRTLVLCFLALLALGVLFWSDREIERPPPSASTAAPEKSESGALPLNDNSATHPDTRLPETPDSEPTPDTNRNSDDDTPADRIEAEWFAHLELSAHPDDLLLASALTTRDPEEQAALLRMAYRHNSLDLLVNLEILKFCSQHPDFDLCQLPFRSTLASLDAGNADTHLLLAMDQAKQENWSRVRREIRTAGQSSRADSHVSDYLQRIGESFQRAGIRRNVASYVVALENVDSLRPEVAVQLFQLCAERTEQSPDWGEDCARAFSVQAQRGDSMTAQSMGTRFRDHFSGIDMDNQMPDIRPSDNQLRIEREAEAMEDKYGRSTMEGDRFNFAMPDDVWRANLDIFRQEGDMAALTHFWDWWMTRIEQEEAARSQPAAPLE